MNTECALSVRVALIRQQPIGCSATTVPSSFSMAILSGVKAVR
jgi:hypothetical protein